MLTLLWLAIPAIGLAVAAWAISWGHASDTIRRGEYLRGVADTGIGEAAAADARWICLTGPGIAEPLADLLETIADRHDAAPCDGAAGACTPCQSYPEIIAAQTLALALTGEAFDAS